MKKVMHTCAGLTSSIERYAVLIPVNSATMLRSTLKHLPLVLVIIVSFAFVGFALAHETDDPNHAHAEVEVGASVETSPKPVKPLDAIRATKQNIQQGAQDAKAQLRINTKAQMENASSGPDKRMIMKGAADARVDIAKERQASSSTLRDRVKGAIRQHAGLIKERFSLALRQFEKITQRIESRIEKLKADGVATATVEAELETAKLAQAEAKADAQAVATFVAGVDESMDRATVRTQLQALIKETQASVKAAHEALQKAVRALSALAKESKPKTDTSASVEAEGGVETTNE